MDRSDPSNRRSSGTLTVTSQEDAATYVLRAAGELDLTNVVLFEDSLRLAEASGAPNILVDLNALSFMDSTGLRALLMAARRVRREPKRLRVSATGAVRRIIQLTGMASYLGAIEGA